MALALVVHRDHSQPLVACLVFLLRTHLQARQQNLRSSSHNRLGGRKSPTYQLPTSQASRIYFCVFRHGAAQSWCGQQCHPLV